MSLPRFVRRLPTALAAVLLLALTTTQAAAPTSASLPAHTIPAVSSLPPWNLPEDPAQEYRELAQSLSELGLSPADTRALWNRLGEQLVPLLQGDSLTPQALNLLLPSNSRAELLSRYLDYAQAQPDLSPQQVVLQVNMGLDRPFYQDPTLISDPSDPLVLVNKYAALPEDYEPELVALRDLGKLGSGSLTPQAAQAFQAMAEAAQADGITLRSVSAYRSYSTQNSLYRRYLSQYSQRFTDTFSARAGHSEHQTGLALDINSASLLDHFEETDAYAWLQEHCAEYGFLLRYPEGKEDITGFRFEPWHYRYVGQEVAKICMEQNLTLEEYLAGQPVGRPDAPSVIWEGEVLELGLGALYLGDTLYLPLEETALALGWTPEECDNGVCYTKGDSRIEGFPGLRCRVNGVYLRFTAPLLSLDGGLYLPADDLCTVLCLDNQMTSAGLVLSARR